jgi:hypothetical protein
MAAPSALNLSTQIATIALEFARRELPHRTETIDFLDWATALCLALWDNRRKRTRVREVHSVVEVRPFSAPSELPA